MDGLGLDGIWKYVVGVRYRASNGANNISIAVWQKVKGKMIAAFQTRTWGGQPTEDLLPFD